MQCDETFFSVRKRHRGSHGSRSVRAEGTQVAQTVAATTRNNKLSEILMQVVPDRTAGSLVPGITELATGERTRIWTDGARHNIRLGQNYKWESVNHRRQWVTKEGVHTNTVECANSIVKKRSKREGGVLGRKGARRDDRVQAYAEQGSGSLKCNGGDALLRVLENIKEHCACVYV